MIIDILATIPLIAIAYHVGYHRGHVHALAVPYAMLAEKMEELMGQNEGQS